MASRLNDSNAVFLGREFAPKGYDRGPITVETLKGFLEDEKPGRHLGDLTAKFGPLLRVLVESARLGGALASGDLYRLTFSPSAATALSDGTLRNVVTDGGLRAWVQEARSGQIVEQGVLKPAQIARMGRLLAGTWQLGATITLQRYLIEINRQLASVEANLKAVSAQLEEDRDGKLTGNLRYLQSHAELIGREILSQREAETLRTQLELIERESSQIGEALKRALDSLIARSKSLKIEWTFWTDELKEHTLRAIDTLVEGLDTYSSSLMAALCARIIATQQILILDPRDSLAAAHAAEIAKEIDECQSRLKSGWTVLIDKATIERRQFEENWKTTPIKPVQIKLSGTPQVSGIEKRINATVQLGDMGTSKIERLSENAAELRQTLGNATSLVQKGHAAKGTGATFVVRISESGLCILEATLT